MTANPNLRPARCLGRSRSRSPWRRRRNVWRRASV